MAEVRVKEYFDEVVLWYGASIYIQFETVRFLVQNFEIGARKDGLEGVELIFYSAPVKFGAVKIMILTILFSTIPLSECSMQ